MGGPAPFVVVLTAMALPTPSFTHTHARTDRHTLPRTRTPLTVPPWCVRAHRYGIGTGLVLQSSRNVTGTNAALGGYTGAEFVWHAGNTPVTTGVYVHTQSVVFSQIFPQGANGTNVTSQSCTGGSEGSAGCLSAPFGTCAPLPVCFEPARPDSRRAPVWHCARWLSNRLVGCAHQFGTVHGGSRPVWLVACTSLALCTVHGGSRPVWHCARWLSARLVGCARARACVCVCVCVCVCRHAAEHSQVCCLRWHTTTNTRTVVCGVWSCAAFLLHRGVLHRLMASCSLNGQCCAVCCHPVCC